jgi:crotonobetainyl-CoA:carnitine CoA-transferase CaiB-like acyl-CoA transferase
MLAALTITTALFARDRKGQAQYIDASIFDVMLSWLVIPLALHLGGDPRMLGGDSPFYRLYSTRDSKLVAVGAIESKFWDGLCRLIGRPDLLPDQYSSEPRRTEVIKAIETALGAKTAEEWFRLMWENDLPCTPVLTLEEVTRDPQARSRRMILERGPAGSSEVFYVGNPCKIADVDQADLSPSPQLGEHTAEILQEIGYSESAVRGFREAGVL